MAEALVSVIIEQLVQVVAENAVQKLKLVTGVEEELKMLQSNFEAIQCLLEDAEEKELVEKRVRHWLGRLKRVSYEMEDVLDEWKTAIRKLEIDGGESVHVRKKVRSLISNIASSSRQVVMRHDIAAKIKEINQEVDAISKEKDMYLLGRSEIKRPRRLESTSFVDVSTLHGRDEIKSEMVSTLLDGNGIQTISILGMGGLGKTALSQLICKDDQVRAHFNKVIWVCVSDLFDPNKIARAILEGLDQSSSPNFQDLISLENVLVKICEKIKNAKFLLVLDDVWTDHDEGWEPLKATFQQGMFGSRILVTTRKESVTMGMESSKVFRLKELSDEVCWLILSQSAFMGKDNELSKKLEGIGKEIAKKCKGLPLAAKTLGGLLREKKTWYEWQNILNSEIWRLNVTKEYIFTPLLLSYYDLPSYIRPCLLYCAIYPKDFNFLPHKLVGHWMAHGYLNSHENLGMEEEKGKEYFNYLASRSFFQDFVTDRQGNIINCKMHDMVHDFVQYLTNEEIAGVEVDSGENVRLDLSSKRAQHLRVMLAEKDQFPVSINGIEKLRSLITFFKLRTRGTNCDQECDITSKGLQALFKAAKCLRVLDFTSLDYIFDTHLKGEEIPNEIEKLIHLRYLNLSYSWNLKELPEEVCELLNLQYLNLYRCKDLEKLPDGIGKLINLRTLCTLRCRSLKYYPKGIGRLTSLRQLDTIKARADGNNANEFSIGDLENLNLLCGSLDIRLEGNVVDEDEVNRVKLHKKKHLEYLNIAGFERDDPVSFLRLLNPLPGLRMEIGGHLYKCSLNSASSSSRQNP